MRKRNCIMRVVAVRRAGRRGPVVVLSCVESCEKRRHAGQRRAKPWTEGETEGEGSSAARGTATKSRIKSGNGRRRLTLLSLDLNPVSLLGVVSVVLVELVVRSVDRDVGYKERKKEGRKERRVRHAVAKTRERAERARRTLDSSDGGD